MVVYILLRVEFSRLPLSRNQVMYYLCHIRAGIESRFSRAYVLNATR